MPNAKFLVVANVATNMLSLIVGKGSKIKNMWNNKILSWKKYGLL